MDETLQQAGYNDVEVLSEGGMGTCVRATKAFLILCKYVFSDYYSP